MDFTKDVMSDELEQVCSSLPNHTDEDRNLRDYVKWLGHLVIDSLVKTGIAYRTGQEEVAMRYFPDPTHKKGTKYPTDLTQAARNLHARAARQLMKHCRAKSKQPGQLYIYIPRGETLPGKPDKLTILFSTVPPPVIKKPLRAELEQRESLNAFWNNVVSFLSEPRGIFIYSNEQPEFHELLDTKGRYSGSGEVAASFLLGRELGRLAIPFEIRRSLGASSDEMDECGMTLLLGSESSNSGYKHLPPEMKATPKGWFTWGVMRSNDGEDATYISRMVDGKEERYTADVNTDFAIVGYRRNHDEDRSVITIAGLGTAGTWAGAILLSDPAKFQALREKLGGSKIDDDLPQFEALLKAGVNNSKPHGRIDVIHHVLL